MELTRCGVDARDRIIPSAEENVRGGSGGLAALGSEVNINKAPTSQSPVHSVFHSSSSSFARLLVIKIESATSVDRSRTSIFWYLL